jgi:hypothetical protein
LGCQVSILVFLWGRRNIKLMIQILFHICNELFLHQRRVWREQNMEEALEYLKIFETFRKARDNLHAYIIHVQIANYSCSGRKVGVYKRWVLLYILNAIWLWGLCGGAVRTQDLEALVSNQKSKFKCKHCNFRTYFTSCPGNGNLQTVPPQNMLFIPSNYSWWIVVVDTTKQSPDAKVQV